MSIHFREQEIAALKYLLPYWQNSSIDRDYYRVSEILEWEDLNVIKDFITALQKIISLVEVNAGRLKIKELSIITETFEADDLELRLSNIAFSLQSAIEEQKNLTEEQKAALKEAKRAKDKTELGHFLAGNWNQTMASDPQIIPEIIRDYSVIELRQLIKLLKGFLSEPSYSLETKDDFIREKVDLRFQSAKITKKSEPTTVHWLKGIVDALEKGLENKINN